MYCVLVAEPLVYLTTIIQGRVLLCMCVDGRALSVSDQYCTRVCAAKYCVLVAEPLVYLTMIIQGCVLHCTVCWWLSPWCI